jgi:peptidoglycan/LPS O-acetylase OafA/YrhL
MQTTEKDIIFLHGIRALSIIWIVLAHSFLMTYWYFPNYNGSEIYEWFKELHSMLILSGAMGVDTFFLLSSFLLTASIFKELDKR